MIELLRRLLIRPGLCAELLLASLFANLLALATPLFAIQVLNRYVAHGVNATLTTLASGAIIAIVLEFGFRQVRNRLARGVSIRPDEQTALAAYGSLTGAKSAALDRLPPGQQREILSGVDHIRNAYSAQNISTVLDLPFAILFLGVLFFLSPTLGVVTAGFAVAAFLVSMALTSRQRNPTRQLMDESRRSGLMIGSAIQQGDTVRAFNAGGFLARAWALQNRKSQDVYRTLVGRQGLLASFSQGLVAFLSVVVMGLGAILVVRGELDIGALIGANILAARAVQPISRFAQLGEPFLKARQAAEQLRDFIRLPRELDTGSAKSNYQGGIEFRDVSFLHPGASGPLFESFNAVVPPGTICVVSGANGAGKSTLARLIAGLIEPNRGQILVDGLELRQVVPEWWRKQLVYLPQEPSFLNATIEENLKIMNPDLDDAAMNAAIDAVGLRHFIDETSQGFSTPIINGGSQLSVGIRRRLALARALTTDGCLVVLDEPTEGLDSKGMQDISQVVTDLHKRGRTVIALSHNPNIISNAQVVIDLNSKPAPKVMTVAHSAALPDEELVSVDVSAGEPTS